MTAFAALASDECCQSLAVLLSARLTPQFLVPVAALLLLPLLVPAQPLPSLLVALPALVAVQ